jgi:Phage stabilisation protein
MALAPIKGWLNPSYLLNSYNASCQRLVNLFAEVIESGDEKAVGYLRGAPGLALINTLPSTGSTGTFCCRGMIAGGDPLVPINGSGGRLFAVVGSLLFELNSSGVPINGLGGNAYRGQVGNDGLPVTMMLDGNNLAVLSAGQFYMDVGTSVIRPTFPAFPYTDISVGWGGTCTVPTASFPLHTSRAGLTIVRQSGPPFNAGMVGLSLSITGDAHSPTTVTGVIDETHLTVATAPNIAYASPVNFTVTPASGMDLVASVASPFAASDVGQTLAFTGGDGTFTAGSYTISAVDAYGNAKLTPQGGTTPPPAAPGSMNGQAAETFGAIGAATGAFLNETYVLAAYSSKSMLAWTPLIQASPDSSFTATKESYPDNIGAIYADHQELLVLGETHSEVWQSPGIDPNFPFAPNESLAMNVGIAARASIASFKDGPVWIGTSTRGQPVAYMAKGFVPTRISTAAIEQVWNYYARFSLISDAIGFTYEIDGHEFWQVSFPTADYTWVYDNTASQQMGKPMWHERNSFDGTSMHRHRANGHAYVFNQHWVGDFANGNIYQLSSTAYDDAGQPITCYRTLPHLCVGRLRQFFTKLQLDLETGGPNALTILLEWSDDGGNNWVGGGSAFTFTASTTKTLDRATFWQLGSADDRVFRITVTGNARKTLINAYLDTIQGIS